MSLLTLAQETSASFFLPPQGSNLAHDVDWAWNIILWTTTFFFCIVVGTMTFFVIRYRRRNNASATSTVTHNTPLEVAWTLIPLVIVVGFFFVGFKGFVNYDNPRSDSTIVDVQAQTWNFQFTYPNGAISDTLYVEKDKPVRLNLHSIDVLHALYIPTFRVQRNLIPYRQTAIWFIPEIPSPPPNPTHNDPGGFSIFCTQYCGNGHSKMVTRVHVLMHDDYEVKMKELANPFKEKIKGKDVYVPYVQVGKKLYTQMGCSTCHTVDGKTSTGPTWLGFWTKDHQFSSTTPPGYTLSAGDPDEKKEEYAAESMLNPSAKVVATFGPMPVSYAGRLSGSPSNDELRRALIEFIKSTGNPNYKPFVDQAAQPDLFDAEKHPVHPESLAARKPQAPVQ